MSVTVKERPSSKHGAGIRLFLSYAAPDRDFAIELARELDRNGLHVTDPMRNVAPGENWFMVVGKALEACSALVVLISPQAVESKWVQSEIDYALSHERFRNRLIPIVVRPTKQMPWIFEKFKTLIADDDVATVARKIVEHLNASGK